jgi:hypothetical protein
LAKWSVWLVGLVPDDQAEQILSRIGDVDISDTSIWRRAAVWGEKIKAMEALQAARAKALPETGAVVRGEPHSGPRMGVAMDGTMINIRQEGCKELKVGCVFEVEMRKEMDRATQQEVERAHAVHNTYAAHLGGPNRFGDLVWGEANGRRWAQALDTLVVGDGAPWIWNLAHKHFGASEQVVDWWHATQHLYEVARLAYGEGTAEAIRWAKQMEDLLFQGQARRVADMIEGLAERQKDAKAEVLCAQAGYFQRNERRMQYMEMRESGWPIGSGMGESGCKQFRARFTGAGMRWSRPGAERMIPIRAAILSRRFDAVWSAAYKSPPN